MYNNEEKKMILDQIMTPTIPNVSKEEVHKQIEKLKNIFCTNNFKEKEQDDELDRVGR